MQTMQKAAGPDTTVLLKGMKTIKVHLNSVKDDHSMFNISCHKLM